MTNGSPVYGYVCTKCSKRWVSDGSCGSTYTTCQSCGGGSYLVLWTDSLAAPAVSDADMWDGEIIPPASIASLDALLTEAASGETAACRDDALRAAAYHPDCNAELREALLWCRRRGKRPDRDRNGVWWAWRDADGPVSAELPPAVLACLSCRTFLETAAHAYRTLGIALAELREVVR